MKRWRYLAVTSLALMVAGGWWAGAGHSASARDIYTIAFTGGLPDDYERIIAEAGGSVKLVLPEIGGVEAVSSDERFAEKLAKGPDAPKIQKETVLPRPVQDGSPAVRADDSPDVGADAYWTAQWVMQQVMIGGQNEQSANAPVVGLVDTGIALSRPDLVAKLAGGINLVPRGSNDSEQGDADDIRDRGGHGTARAQALLGKQTSPRYRVYRIYADEGGVPFTRLLQAVVRASDDRVGSVEVAIGAASERQKGATGEAERLLLERAARYASDHEASLHFTAGDRDETPQDLPTAETFWRAYGI